jgi:hypothetical protein
MMSYVDVSVNLPEKTLEIRVGPQARKAQPEPEAA